MIHLLRIAFVLLMITLLAACGFTKAKTAAEKAVDLFHKQYNENRFSEIYSAAAPEFKKGFKETDFTYFIQVTRSKMGVHKSSSESSWRTNATTSGTFITLHYKSEFEHSTGIEDFTFIVLGDSAKLFRIDVNSPLLPPS